MRLKFVYFDRTHRLWFDVGRDDLVEVGEMLAKPAETASIPFLTAQEQLRHLLIFVPEGKFPRATLEMMLELSEGAGYEGDFKMFRVGRFGWLTRWRGEKFWNRG